MLQGQPRELDFVVLIELLVELLITEGLDLSSTLLLVVELVTLTDCFEDDKLVFPVMLEVPFALDLWKCLVRFFRFLRLNLRLCLALERLGSLRLVFELFSAVVLITLVVLADLPSRFVDFARCFESSLR